MKIVMILMLFYGAPETSVIPFKTMAQCQAAAARINTFIDGDAAEEDKIAYPICVETEEAGQ